MSTSKRLRAVVVMYAIFILAFSVLQALVPGFDFVDTWFHSLPLQLLVFAIFWLLAPLLVRLVEREEG